MPEIARLQLTLDMILNKLDILPQETVEPIEDVQSVETENIQDDTSCFKIENS